MYRFLLTPRWLAGAALAVALAALCVLLGTWQWDRREQRLAANTPILENYDDSPQPLTDVLASPTADLAPGAEWTPVRVNGEYLTEHTLLLRNRPLNGRPGYHVLVPLALEAGGVLLVDRGWVPTGATGSGPDAVPAPPPGPVEAVVRLRPEEPPANRSAPAGQLHRLDLDAAARELALPGDAALVTGAYGVVDTETPSAATTPAPLPRPDIDEGPHLSYSLQWFVFAGGVFVGYGVLARRTAAELRAGVGAPATAPRQRRRVSAEDEEDAILDAAERSRAPR